MQHIWYHKKIQHTTYNYARHPKTLGDWINNLNEIAKINAIAKK